MPLYIVPTPIGNLADITRRALDVLRDADVIACEDTRRTRRLLEAHGIRGKCLVSYHEHNEKRRASELVEELSAGRAVALVTNAGTPLVSDPGYRLVRAAVDAGAPVVPLPGPCAAVAALSASGLPVHRFTFVGFPPKGPGKLRSLLREEIDNPGTLILYESPHRVAKLLAAAAEVFGEDRRAAVCRELTKLHEEILRGSIAELARRFAGADHPADDRGEVDAAPATIRGEFVVLIGPAPA